MSAVIAALHRRRPKIGFVQLRLWGAIAATASVVALNTVLSRM